MGVSKSPAELARKFQRIADAVGNLDRDGVRAAAFVVKDQTQREMRQAVGADLRMSGIGRRGARIGTTFDIKGAQNPTAFVRAFGPAHIPESGTRPHVITPRRRRRAGKRAMSIPGIGVRARVNHPGSPAKHPWRTGVTRSIPLVQAAFRKGLHTSMVKVFG